MRTVSKRTENFIGCITAMHDLYSKCMTHLMRCTAMNRQSELLTKSSTQSILR